jgi:type II secretory pathway pseudopilin PulG
MSSFCPACGNSLAADDNFCRVCGRSNAATAVATPEMSPLAPSASAETSGKAIVSLVCGLLFFVPMAFIAAIVFGHLAISEIRKSAGRLKGESMAMAGLVLGYIWIAGIPIFLIIAAIAIPNLLRAKMAANESSAVATVRILETAEITYSTKHPDRGYTCYLGDLSGEQLIDSELASGKKTGYQFDLLNCVPGNPGGANIKFQVVSQPITPNQTGVRAFCSDESAVIKVDPTGSLRGCLQDGKVL